MAISLSSLKKNVRKPPRILVYGPEKMGKTTFAVCKHSPQEPDGHPGAVRPGVVVIQTEDGLGDLDAMAFPLATSYEDVEEAMGALYQDDHQFTDLVVDSLDWLEPLIWDYTCRENGWKGIEDVGYGKGYVAADATWRRFFAGINALRDDRGMTVILVAHQQIVRVEDPESPAYDMATIKLHKRATGIVGEYTDVILKASMKTFLSTDPNAKADAKKKGDARQLAVTTGQRVLTCQPRPGALAGNRYHLPAELPLDWSAFDAAMKASLARKPE
jgi:hypothetical protein